MFIYPCKAQGRKKDPDLAISDLQGKYLFLKLTYQMNDLIIGKKKKKGKNPTLLGKLSQFCIILMEFSYI